MVATTCIIAFMIARMGYLVPINIHNAMVIKAIQDQFFYSTSRPSCQTSHPSPPCNIASPTRLNVAITIISPYLICQRPTSKIRTTSSKLLTPTTYCVTIMIAT